MATAEFRNVISEPWLSLEPVRVGQVPSGVGTPDLYVIVDAGEKLLRVDIHLSGYDCGAPFEEVAIWGDLVIIGCCHHVFVVPLYEGEVTTIDLGGYFGHLYISDNALLVASQSQLFRISRKGELIWTSPEIGIDGVEVERTQDGIVHGQGEWNPPGGSKPFAVSLDSGESLS
jgi:hypothetical protein